MPLLQRVGVPLVGSEAGERGLAGTIVLLHGGASNRRWWDAVAARLAVRRHVVWWDARGHGESGDARVNCAVAQLADDTMTVLDTLDLHDAILVGHSAGAAVALRAARSPRVAAVVCVDGGVYEPRVWPGEDWRSSISSRRPTSATVLDAWRAGAALPPEALPAILANYRAGADGRLIPRIAADDEEHLARGLHAEDLASVLADVCVPVDALLADDGDIVGYERRVAALGVARRTLGPALSEHWLAGGHDLPLQHPRAVAREIERVAARHDAVPAGVPVAAVAC